MPLAPIIIPINEQMKIQTGNLVKHHSFELNMLKELLGIQPSIASHPDLKSICAYLESNANVPTETVTTFSQALLMTYLHLMKEEEHLVNKERIKDRQIELVYDAAQASLQVKFFYTTSCQIAIRYNINFIKEEPTIILETVETNHPAGAARLRHYFNISTAEPVRAPRPQPVYQPIPYTSKSEFFIAIMRPESNRNRKLNYHNYITLGIRQGDSYHLLAAFGKLSGELSLSKLGFNSSIANELSFQKGLVNYKAFALTFTQYIAFLDYMGWVSKHNSHCPLNAYYPTNDTELTYIPIPLPAKPTKLFSKADTTSLTLFNTCRHTAIQLIQEALQVMELGNGVSTLFFRKLPLQTHISNTRCIRADEFLVMPPPPQSAYNTLTPIYKRLDTILDNTAEFKFLLSLYRDPASNHQQLFEQACHELKSALPEKSRANKQEKLARTILKEIQFLRNLNTLHPNIAIELLNCTRLGLSNPHDTDNIAKFNWLAQLLPDQGDRALFLRGVILVFIGVTTAIACLVVGLALPAVTGAAISYLCCTATAGAITAFVGVNEAMDEKPKPLAVACSQFWKKPQALKTQNLEDTKVKIGRTISTMASASV